MKFDSIIIISIYILMVVQMAAFGVFLRKKGRSIGGVAPVNRILFGTAKIAMFLVWLAMCFQATGKFNLIMFDRPLTLTIISVGIFLAGYLLQLISYLNLGLNLKFGIPDEEEGDEAVLKTDGFYSLSRNPMYTGFLMIIAGASLYVLNPLIWLLSIYTAVVHHQIVLKEEKFLAARFESSWTEYASVVRRYI